MHNTVSHMRCQKHYIIPSLIINNNCCPDQNDPIKRNGSLVKRRWYFRTLKVYETKKLYPVNSWYNLINFKEVINLEKNCIQAFNLFYTPLSIFFLHAIKESTPLTNKDVFVHMFYVRHLAVRIDCMSVMNFKSMYTCNHPSKTYAMIVTMELPLTGGGDLHRHQR